MQEDLMGQPVIKTGDTIRVDYTIRLEDGTVIGSTYNDEPVEFVVGEGDVLPGLERAVLGMTEGDSLTVDLRCTDAYGPRLDELVETIDRKNLPQNFAPFIGQRLDLRSDDNDELTVTVVDMTENTVTLDANHKLAGKNVILNFKILEIIG